MKKTSEETKAKFISMMRKTCNVSYAAECAKISRRAVYSIKNKDPKFAQEWEDAEEYAVDSIELEVWKRAFGVERPIIRNGKITGHAKQYSDKLLMALLRAHKPEKYRDRVIHNEITGADKGPIQIIEQPATQKLREFLAQYDEIKKIKNNDNQNNQDNTEDENKPGNQDKPSSKTQKSAD